LLIVTFYLLFATVHVIACSAGTCGVMTLPLFLLLAITITAGVAKTKVNTICDKNL